MIDTENQLNNSPIAVQLVPCVFSAKKVLIATAFTLLAVSTANTAWGNEQFSLNSTPDILFDGSNSDNGPITGEHNGIPYEIIQGYAVAQGDMVLGRLFANGKLEIPITTRGLAAGSLLDRWPDGIVPFQFAEDTTQSMRTKAMQAVEHWNSKTKILLLERNSANADLYPNYVSFEASNGCASWVGRIGGEQAVWIADNCSVGSIIHEIGHAIGVFHEHTRSDRDNYIQINWENISPGKDFNFKILDDDADLVGNYDYGSIMHYGERYFSNNGELTISAPDNIVVGQREALSADDIATINLMYSTDIELNLSTHADELENAINIDINVSNRGALGANQLELTANIGADSSWLSISSDSGWECQQFGTELRCTRNQLLENSTSTFTVKADPNSSTIEDLSVRVIARTLDTNLSNNVFNDEIIVEQEAQGSTQTDSTPIENNSEPSNESQDNPTPNLQAGNSTPETSNSGHSTNTGGSGGGATNWWFLLLMLPGLFRKRLIER